MSLLERLMTQSDIYHRDPNDNEYDDRVITKLVTNYRSHEVLLHIPNKLFYDNELKVSMWANRWSRARKRLQLFRGWWGIKMEW